MSGATNPGEGVCVVFSGGSAWFLGTNGDIFLEVRDILLRAERGLPNVIWLRPCQKGLGGEILVGHFSRGNDRFFCGFVRHFGVTL